MGVGAPPVWVPRLRPRGHTRPARATGRAPGVLAAGTLGSACWELGGDDADAHSRPCQQRRELCPLTQDVLHRVRRPGAISRLHHLLLSSIAASIKWEHVHLPVSGWRWGKRCERNKR